GYRWPDATIPASDESFLQQAVKRVATAAAAARIGVILGTERITADGLQITAAVIDNDGTILGWQDKVQLDPAEEPFYPAVGRGRHIFEVAGVRFGVV